MYSCRSQSTILFEYTVYEVVRSITLVNWNYYSSTAGPQGRGLRQRAAGRLPRREADGRQEPLV
jgi:hypothetical protein